MLLEELVGVDPEEEALVEGEVVEEAEVVSIWDHLNRLLSVQHIGKP